MIDSVWQRHGISWLWDPEALKKVASAPEVVSLRQYMRMVGKWPEELPSNKGTTLVVAGLDAAIDLQSPDEASEWLANEYKKAILSFQSYSEGETSLIFWMPDCAQRITINAASDAVLWTCGQHHHGQSIEFGRLLWGEAHEYPREILLREGASRSGLFHLRIT